VFKERWSFTSLEIVVGSLQRNLLMSLKDMPFARESAMNFLSSRVRCFWLPGISFDIGYLLSKKDRAVRKE